MCNLSRIWLLCRLLIVQNDKLWVNQNVTGSVFLSGDENLPRKASSISEGGGKLHPMGSFFRRAEDWMRCRFRRWIQIILYLRDWLRDNHYIMLKKKDSCVDLIGRFKSDILSQTGSTYPNKLSAFRLVPFLNTLRHAAWVKIGTLHLYKPQTETSVFMFQLAAVAQTLGQGEEKIRFWFNIPGFVCKKPDCHQIIAETHRDLTNLLPQTVSDKPTMGYNGVEVGV